MKKNLICVLAFFAFTLSFNRAKADSYGYIGASGGAWTTPGNWYDYTTGAVATTKYPGKTAVGDIVQGYYTGTNAVTLTTATALYSLAQINVADNQTFQITLNNGANISVTNGINIGDAAQGNNKTSYLYVQVSGTGAGAINVSGPSTIAKNSELYVNAGYLSFNSGATMALTGPAAYPSFIYNTGSITGTCAYTIGTYSEIENLGIFTTSSGSSFTLNGADAEILNYAGTFTANTTTFTLSAANALISNYAGSSTANFVVNSCSMTLSGSASEIYNYGYNYASNFTANSSTINLTGLNSEIYSDAYSSPTYISTCNINATTINLGSTGGGDGSGAFIYNTDESVFYLNASSIINLNGPNTKINNALYSGATYYGTFVCAPSSVINPTSTTCVITNTTTGTSTTSNPATCFTLLSDNTGTATIGQDNGVSGNMTGQFNVQRYITGGSLAYRNYRLLACPTNTRQSAPSSANYTNLAYLSANSSLYNVTGPAYAGAFVAGPGTSFGTGIHSITNPLIYLYQESITPGSTYNSSFTSGKNVGVTTYSTGTSPYYIGTTSTAAGGVTNTNVLLPAGNGYLLYYIDWNNRTTAASIQSVPNPSTITASGFLNQGDVLLYMWGTSPTATLTYTTTPTALVRNPGLTMVGNPYAATLDLYKFYNYASNTSVLNGTFYELNDATQQFPAYNGASNTTSGPAGGSEYVSNGQGFYVVTKVAGSLTFKENQKATTTTGPVFPSPILEDVNPSAAPAMNNVSKPAALKQTDAVAVAQNTKGAPSNFSVRKHLDIIEDATRTPVGLFAPAKSNNSNNVIIPATPSLATATAPLTTVNPSLPAAIHLKLVQDSIQYDECGIYFSSAWADSYDKYDSFDLDGLNPKVYLSSFTSDNVRTAINAMGDYSKGKRIKLYVKAAADGLYQFQLEDLKNFKSAHYNVFLIDNQLHDSLDMGKYKTFNVNLVAADTASYANRFVLAIEHAPVPQYALVSFSGQKISSGVQLDWKTVNEGNYTGFVLQKLVNNTYVSIDSLLSDSLSSYDFIDQHPSLGSNVYRLQQNEVSGNVVYTAPITIGYNSNTSATGNLTVYPNPSKNVINITLALSTTLVPGYSVNIYDAAGAVTSQRTINTTSWTEDVSSYKTGIYIIRIKDKNGNLVGKSKFAKVN